MGQSCSQDHDVEASEVNQEVLTAKAQLQRQKETFENFKKHHADEQAKFKREITDLEKDKSVLEREKKVLEREISVRNKEIKGHVNEIAQLQDLISRAETKLSETERHRDQLNQQLREAESELNGSKYKKEREKIAKMKSEAKSKKDDLKMREKEVTKREKQTKKILEQQQILEKRLEECNKREIAVEKVEEAQKAQVAKHMQNVQQTHQMKQMLAQMNDQLAARKLELHEIEEEIKRKEERADDVLRKESDIKMKHDEITKLQKEKEEGILSLRKQLTQSRLTQSNLLKRQEVVEATAKLTEEETVEIARQKKLIVLQQSDLERLEAELEEKKKELEDKESELALRQQEIDDDEADIEVQRLALQKLQGDSRNAFVDDSEPVQYYQSKTNLFKQNPAERGSFRVKGGDRQAIQASDKSNLYAQAFSVQKASEKLAGVGTKKDPSATPPPVNVTEYAGRPSNAPALPPRPDDAPRRKSNLIAPPNLPKFDHDED